MSVAVSRRLTIKLRLQRLSPSSSYSISYCCIFIVRIYPDVVKAIIGQTQTKQMCDLAKDMCNMPEDVIR